MPTIVLAWSAVLEVDSSPSQSIMPVCIVNHARLFLSERGLRTVESLSMPRHLVKQLFASPPQWGQAGEGLVPYDREADKEIWTRQRRR